MSSSYVNIAWLFALFELALRGLSVRRRLPTRAQVGRPHLVEIEVHNQKRKVPSYAIEVEDIRANQPADKRCFSPPPSLRWSAVCFGSPARSRT